MSYAIARNRNVNSDINKLYPEDRSIHEWYRFVLSFPPHLVRAYLERFGRSKPMKFISALIGAVPITFFLCRQKAAKTN